MTVSLMGARSCTGCEGGSHETISSSPARLRASFRRVFAPQLVGGREAIPLEPCAQRMSRSFILACVPTCGSSIAMRHIIAILLQNEAGALARVAGLFSTRGYNIESLSVAPTDDPTVSRLTLVTTGSEAVMQQIANQLNKLVDVVSTEDMTGGEHLERELILLKLRVRPERTDGVRGYVVRTGGRVLDPATDGFIVELTASEGEINTFVTDLAQQAELLEVVRSGALGIGRNARPLRVVR
jgi:acetolactate synthase-1/3 small subunit